MKFKYKGKYYIWSVNKFFINLFVIIFLSIVSLLYINSVKAGNKCERILIITHRGDTLWSIAQQVEPKTDPREVIKSIKKENKLNNASLGIGKKLVYQEENNF
jgi:hypothetical protein